MKRLLLLAFATFTVYTSQKGKNEEEKAKVPSEQDKWRMIDRLAENEAVLSLAICSSAVSFLKLSGKFEEADAFIKTANTEHAPMEVMEKMTFYGSVLCENRLNKLNITERIEIVDSLLSNRTTAKNSLLFEYDAKKLLNKEDFGLTKRESDFKKRVTNMKKGKPVPKYSHLPPKFLEKKIEEGHKKLKSSLEILEGDGLIHKGVISGFLFSLIPILLVDWLLFRRGSQPKKVEDSGGLSKEEERLRRELDAEKKIIEKEMKNLVSKSVKEREGNPVIEGEEEDKEPKLRK